MTLLFVVRDDSKLTIENFAPDDDSSHAGAVCQKREFFSLDKGLEPVGSTPGSNSGLLTPGSTSGLNQSGSTPASKLDINKCLLFSCTYDVFVSCPRTLLFVVRDDSKLTIEKPAPADDSSHEGAVVDRKKGEFISLDRRLENSGVLTPEVDHFSLSWILLGSSANPH